MSNAPSPLPPITTNQLLAVIARHGKSWPAAMAEHSIETLSGAVGREITSRNLIDGATLSERGRQTLARANSAASGDRMTARRDDDCPRHEHGCWRITCRDCGQALRKHLPGQQLENAVADALTDHLCRPDPDKDLQAVAAG
jgi:hypothetical protein